MIYNFNLGIGWASSGVEYAQIYRAKMFRNIGVDAKFVFTDMFPQENIEYMTKNIGFEDSEVIWLYIFFTDFKTAPVTYTLSELEKTFTNTEYTKSREGKICRYVFNGSNNFYTAYMVNDHDDFVHRVELVSNGFLIRKDYFTYGRVYSEYYAPLDNAAHLYHRRFFNENGSVAYEEIIDDDRVMYKFKDKILCSKEELVGYMVSKLNLTSVDVILIDRSTDIGQSILMNCKPARVGTVVHADHFSEKETNENYILWNNYYEYEFNMHKHIDFYICSTQAQSDLMVQQFEKYYGMKPCVYTIPVGSLPELKYPKKGRKPYSLITASRLASEKHVDWICKAVIQAHAEVSNLQLDIYGEGVEREKIENIIRENNASSYIHLMGQHDLSEVYQNYEAYIAGSTSEGFGLTLMEAVGGGLPIIGFDVRYGNPTFIRNGENGYLMPLPEEDKDRVEALRKGIVDLFKQDLVKCHEVSYEVAKDFLTSNIQEKWREAVC
jgi:poly(glycerol-phosphate) alpha-glucosyltransferase